MRKFFGEIFEFCIWKKKSIFGWRNIGSPSSGNFRFTMKLKLIFPYRMWTTFLLFLEVSWDTPEMISTSSCGWSGSLRVNIPMKSVNRIILPNVENSGWIRKERRLYWIVWCTSCHITDLEIWSWIIRHLLDLTGRGMQSLDIKILIWRILKKLTLQSIGSLEYTGKNLQKIHSEQKLNFWSEN